MSSYYHYTRLPYSQRVQDIIKSFDDPVEFQHAILTSFIDCSMDERYYLVLKALELHKLEIALAMFPRNKLSWGLEQTIEDLIDKAIARRNMIYIRFIQRHCDMYYNHDVCKLSTVLSNLINGPFKIVMMGYNNPDPTVKEIIISIHYLLYQLNNKITNHKITNDIVEAYNESPDKTDKYVSIDYPVPNSMNVLDIQNNKKQSIKTVYPKILPNQFIYTFRPTDASYTIVNNSIVFTLKSNRKRKISQITSIEYNNDQSSNPNIEVELLELSDSDDNGNKNIDDLMSVCSLTDDYTTSYIVEEP